MDRTPKTNETEAQAAQWLIRLEEQSSATARAQWLYWLSQDVRRHATYVRLENSWRQSDCLQRLRPLDGTIDVNVLSQFPGLEPRLRSSRTRHQRAVTHWILIAMVTLTTVLAWIWLSLLEP